MPDKSLYLLPTASMRGSQDALLFDHSDNHSLTSSRSSINQFDLDHRTGSHQTELVFPRTDQKPCSNGRIQPDYLPCTANRQEELIGGGGGGGVLFNFQRRMSMQLGSSHGGANDSLKRLKQKSRTRRGSIPCLSPASSTSVCSLSGDNSNPSSQTCLLKSSHTAPNPFPELLASPPPPPPTSSQNASSDPTDPPPAISHGRSQSSCVDDRLSTSSLTADLQEDTGDYSNCCYSGDSSMSSTQSPRVQDSDPVIRRNTIDSSYNHRPAKHFTTDRKVMEKQISLGSCSSGTLDTSPFSEISNNSLSNHSRLALANSSSSSSINSTLVMEPVHNSYVHPSLIASKVRQIVSQSHSNPGSPAIPRRQVTASPTGTTATQQGTLQSQPVDPTYSDLRKRSPSISPTGSVGRVSPDRLSNLYEQSSALWSAQGYTKQMLMVHTDASNYKTVTISENMTALDVTQLLVDKTQAGADKTWALVERLPKFNLERSLEDHELVYPTYRSWGNAEHNQFWFQKDFKKYEFFNNPSQFLPACMLDWKDGASPKSSPKLCPKSDRHTTLLLQNLFSTSERLPDIQGNLYMKESRRSWKKHFFVLRASGLYYSNKGTSKEPKHLVLYAQLTDFLIYHTNNAKKALGAPNNHCICLKPPYCVSDPRELKLLCTEDEASRMSWLTALRLNKYGSTLQDNYKQAVKAERQQQNPEQKGSHSPRTYTSSKLNVKSRVAMDFTGLGGRVVEDPNEALGVAIQESQQWRKKAPRGHQCSRPSECQCQAAGFLSENPSKCQHGLQSGVHMSQPWFHSGILRDEAVMAIQRDGLVDGVFLVRESQSIPGSYVLSLAHNGKVKHCTIKTYESDVDLCFSMDGGHTRFLDLIQLVEFYQLNANGLPTRLTHYVTRIV